MTRVARKDGNLADPASPDWAAVDKTAVALSPIPLDAQPTEYIKTKWADLSYGNVGTVDLAAAISGDRLHVRLEWADSETPNTEFADSACVYFPANGDAPAETIGSADAPVNIWYWQADREAPLDLVGSGPGVFRDAPSSSNVQAAASLDNGRWAVVISGDVTGGAPASCAVAVWDGSNEERAGIGSAGGWIQLDGDN